MPRYYYDIFAPCLKKPIQKTLSLEPPEQTHLKKKHHWSHRTKSIQKNERDERAKTREKMESRDERETSTDK